MNEILKLNNISKNFQDKLGETKVLKDVNLSVLQGEFISIVGPSGCGKSTLLSIIAGLIKASEGEVIISETMAKNSIITSGYMLQKDHLLPWRSISKNIYLGLELNGQDNKGNIDYAKNLIEKYGLLEFKDKFPSQISGGMRQRASLIRTLAARPKILLLDEAFSALDYQTKIKVTEDVRSIIRKEGITTIMVTHDIPEAISMSDKVVVLTKRPATIKKVYNMEFDSNLKPMERRSIPLFQEYYSKIWKEVDIDE